MRSLPSETCWPTASQELLLKAALLEGEEAVRAWSDLTAALDPDSLEEGSRRLLPLVWNNLSRQERWKNHPSLNGAQTLYRQTLAGNTLLLRQAASFLKDLRAICCPAILLKGLALIIRGYRNRGLRPMADFDVLIPEERREEVISIMQSEGWAPTSRAGGESFSLPYREVVHGHLFTREGNWSVDLHWHAMEECVWPGADDAFWKGAEGIELEGVPAAILSRPDQLLHLCVHGLKWEDISTIRWVADAHILMEDGAGNFDWERLLEQACSRRLTLPTAEALRYLVRLLGAPVPEGILRRLAHVPVPARERKEFRHRTCRGSSRTLGFVPTLWYKHSRIEEGAHILHKVWHFPSFIMKYWGIAGWRELPSFLVKAISRRTLSVKR